MMGTEKTYHQQQYVCVGLRQHRRRDGTISVLAEWQSECAQCGDRFSFFIPSLSGKFMPNRRCRQHKRPGVRVSPKSETQIKPGEDS